MRRLVLLSLLVLVPTAGAGLSPPPLSDCCAAWSPDGTYISFVTVLGGRAFKDVKPDGTAEQTVLSGEFGTAALSPDWKKLGWTSSGQLKMKIVATGEIRTLASNVQSFVWAPDSSRIAALSNGTLAIVDLAGNLGPPLAQNASDPAWSPAGDRIAVVEQTGADYDVHVIETTGRDVDLTAGDRRANLRPVWSRQGSLALLTRAATHDTVQVLIGSGGLRALTTRLPITNGVMEWLPSGRELALGLSEGVLVVDISTGRTRRLLPFGVSQLVPSPDGARLAFVAFGECGDREGVYVARADGTGSRRITNGCRILGTSGNDTLRGTEVADVLVGLGGNDRLFASDPGYVGDTLLGGPGNDVLIGAFRRDTLDGGPGDDVLDGGPSGDTLIGGKGRDHLNGQGGADVIRAVDGERDVITCGPNSYGPSGRDTVYADTIDSVASNCEIVHRS